MKTAGAVSASNMIAPVVSFVKDIPINRIQESKTNPRRLFDDVKPATSASTGSCSPFSFVHCRAARTAF